MAARITVKAELASLLAKSQETTNANRQAQLRKEADVRADRQRLQVKDSKIAATRKRRLEDPVVRNIFTAAMGTQVPILGAWWLGGTQTDTGFFAPYQSTSTVTVRSGDFTASITEDLGYTGSLSSPGVGDFGFLSIFTTFPLAGSDSAIVMYAKVPTADLAAADAGDYAVFESLAGGASPPPGGFDPDDFTIKQFWFLVTETTVERIADLTYPFYARAYHQTGNDPLPPFDTGPSLYLSRELNYAAKPLGGVTQEISDSFSGIFSPVSYGVRRLYDGEPYSSVTAFPGHSSLNKQPMADSVRIAYPITLTPEEFEGFNLYGYWDAKQPELCTSELALIGYPPP